MAKKIVLKSELLGTTKSTFDVVSFANEYNLSEIQKVYPTKSSQMRYLYSEGFKPAEIFTILKTVYPKLIRQHVHNVINQHKAKLVK